LPIGWPRLIGGRVARMMGCEFDVPCECCELLFEVGRTVDRLVEFLHLFGRNGGRIPGLRVCVLDRIRRSGDRHFMPPFSKLNCPNLCICRRPRAKGCDANHFCYGDTANKTCADARRGSKFSLGVVQGVGVDRQGRDFDDRDRFPDRQRSRQGWPSRQLGQAGRQRHRGQPNVLRSGCEAARTPAQARAQATTIGARPPMKATIPLGARIGSWFMRLS
jgi:hypothetical protein